MVTRRRGTPNASARKATRASLAAPSTGAAARRTTIAPPRSPSTRVRGARGITRIVMVARTGAERIASPYQPGGSESARRGVRGATPLGSTRRLAFVGTGFRRTLRRDHVGLTRTMEQDVVVAARLVLFADELERAVQRLNGRLERALGVAPPQLQLVDVAIQLLEPPLRLLQQQVGAALRLADDELGL